MKFGIPILNYAFLVNLGVFIFGALMLVIKSGYSYGPIFLLLLSLPLLLQRETYQLDKTQGLIILVLLFYPLVKAVSIILDTNTRWRDFDLPSRVLFSIGIFLLLLRYRPSFKAIGYGFAVGAISAGLLASYQKFMLGIERALGHATMVIQAGDISMAMGLICLSFVVYFYRCRDKRHTLLFTVAACMGALGSLLSGSRGGWVMMPLILLIFYVMHRNYFSTKFKVIACSLLIVGLCVIALPQFGVTARINEARSDVALYLSGQNKDTSVGIRFQLWQSAWDSFTERPVFGWGHNSVRLSKQSQRDQGLISEFIYNFNSHAHNEYLNELAIRGGIGFIALLLIFWVPLNLFRRIVKQTSDAQIQTVAVAGIMVVLATMDFCLSQAFLKHNSGVMFYFPVLVVFLAFCFNGRNRV